MINTRVLLRAAVVGIVLLAVLVGAGHFIPYIAEHFFLFGGMMITATSGYLYGMDTGAGYFPGATGGALTGGAGGLFGAGLAVLIKDGAQTIIPFFTSICVLTGAVGGLFGQMAANMRKMNL